MMRAVEGPRAPFVVRDPTNEALYLTLKRPARQAGRISFDGWPVGHYPPELGRAAVGYRLLEAEMRWREIDARRVSVETAPAHLKLPAKVQAALDGEQA